MFCSPQIQIHHLFYTAPGQRSLLFNDLNLSLGANKVALVGPNGVGKSTLLKLILKELMPQQGHVQADAAVAYCPQEFFIGEQTVAQVLGIADKREAYARILAGSSHINDFNIMDEDWNFMEVVHTHLARFALSESVLDQTLSSLSGGELTKVLLTKTFMTKANFMILDEPTNNLDADSKALLMHAIDQFAGGMLIVTHDRALLNKMEQVVEITQKNVQLYTGNYEDYREQKAIHQHAQQQRICNTILQQQKAKKQIQTRLERHHKSSVRGKKDKVIQIKAKGVSNKLANHMAQERSDRTKKRILTQAHRKLDTIDQTLNEAKARVEQLDTIRFDLQATHVPARKMVLELQDLTFSYDDKTLFQDFNLRLTGPSRVLIKGANGSGKTTLAKLIMGELQPLRGTVTTRVEHIAYLDQQAKCLDPNLTVLENYLKQNPKATPATGHAVLAQFLFKNIQALKRIKHLSGGEKLRAMLACTLASPTPPQLIILDEPTNHLDLDSIYILEKALDLYKGAMLIISHDQYFVDALKSINKTIKIM